MKVMVPVPVFSVISIDMLEAFPGVTVTCLEFSPIT